MSSERFANRKLPLLLTFAGLLSGITTAALFYIAGQVGMELLLGAVFGAILSGFLMAVGILQTIWSAVRFAAISVAAYFLSVMASIAVQLALAPFLSPDEQWSMGHPMADSPLAFLVGGLAGSFLLCGELLYLCDAKPKWRVVAIRTLPWSMFGGALALIGWALAPSLGAVLWYVFHAAHLAGHTTGPQDILYGYGEARLLYSLHVVWQTGTGLVLGFVLQRHRAKPLSKEGRPHEEIGQITSAL